MKFFSKRKSQPEAISGSIHQDFPRGVAGPLTGTPPMAQFMQEDLIRQTPSLQYRPGAYFLGVIGGQVHTERAASGRLLRWVQKGQSIGYTTNKHITTFAPTRSDKGRACVNTNALLYPGSMVLTSAKDDLVRETIRQRHATFNQECCVIAPFHKLAEFSEYLATFNPLSLLLPDSETLVEDADLISDALIVPDADAEPHWSEKARSFVGRGLILHVATHEQYRHRRDLVAVYDNLMGRNKHLQEEMLSNDAADGAVIDAAHDYYDCADNERGSVLSTARRHLAFMAYPPIQRVLLDENRFKACPSKKTVNLAALKQGNITLYICIPAMRLGTCGRLFRMMIQLTLAALERDSTKPRYPVRLVMDEFAAYDRMTSLEKAVGQIAGLDCQLHFILQDLPQLQAIYDKRSETFLANSGIIQAFAPSDNITLQWLEQRLGTTTILAPSLTGVSGEFKKDFEPTSWQAQSHPLQTAQEISRFFGQQDGLVRQLVIAPGFDPLVLQRAYYDKNELFKAAQ